MSYMRVVPRDLFNESKLLKCLGRISIDILDGNLGQYGVSDYLEDERAGFIISQDDDGNISCANYHVLVKYGDSDQIDLHLYTTLNNKQPYPLICITHYDEMISVFRDSGKYTKEFIRYLKLLNNDKGSK